MSDVHAICDEQLAGARRELADRTAQRDAVLAAGRAVYTEMRRKFADAGPSVDSAYLDDVAERLLAGMRDALKAKADRPEGVTARVGGTT